MGSCEIREVGTKRFRSILSRRMPWGSYLTKEGGLWIALDNRTGDAWTEEFCSRQEAVRWLLGAFEVCH